MAGNLLKGMRFSKNGSPLPRKDALFCVSIFYRV
jgi:hypothetical protein